VEGERLALCEAIDLVTAVALLAAASGAAPTSTTEDNASQRDSGKDSV
jgi:hypothetical protein